MYSFIPTARLRACLNDAASAPHSEAGRRYPRWYLRQWHYLPEGYLSRRSTALYEAMVPKLYNLGREGDVVDRLMHIARSEAPESVLEMGCGPGHLLRRLAAALPEATLAGVDLSPFMLELAAGNASTAAGGRLSLRHVDARSLPWADESFDLVVAMHLLGHVPPPAARAMLAEAGRVLRHGGRLVAVDHRWHRLPQAPGVTPGGREAALGGLLSITTYRKDR